MKTPITDAAYTRFVKDGNVNKNLVGPMVRLESDRSRLMQTLDLIRRVSTDSWAAKEAKEALDSAMQQFDPS